MSPNSTHSHIYDIAVLGAGPAGIAAAIQASQQQCEVLLIDEQPQAGGQIWRAKSDSIISAPATPESINADESRQVLATSGITHSCNSRVWHFEKQANDIWILYLVTNGQSSQIQCRALILATGAYERVFPVPGWTLPGVLGLAGATSMFKEYQTLHGSHTLVCGTGPLVFYVASEILRLGGSISAVVTLNSRLDWLQALPGMLGRPALLRRGFAWMLELKRRGVPVHWAHAVHSISGSSAVENVNIIPVDRTWAWRREVKLNSIATDSVCMGQGLLPSIEAARLAGVATRYDASLGGWIPDVETDTSTSVSGLYVCGDGAGILGVDVAQIQGKIAGLTASNFVKQQEPEKPSSLMKFLLYKFAKLKNFGLAMTRLSIPRDGQLKIISPETIICRCEDVTYAELQSLLQRGATTATALKSESRAGMGPCGGKFCMEMVLRLTAKELGQPISELKPPSVRPPLRPVALEAITGDFQYDDLPIPKSAPL